MAQLRVAIIGAGPAGLGAAIEFSKLPFVDWKLYEQATVLREIGAGISIQPSTWRLLEHLGAAANLQPADFYRPPDNHYVQHRNGRTGELLVSHGQEAFPEVSSGVPKTQLHARTHRAKLQQALIDEVDQSRVRLSSRLVSVVKKPSGKLLIEFQDGFKDEVDLVVGADGVRSVVRNFAFPDHQVGYIGRTSYRTIVTSDEIATVAGVPDAVTFWHGPHAWLYTCSLGDGKFEITTNTREPASLKEKDFAPVVKSIVALPKEIKQYALFAGPRLDNIIAHGSVVLVGDASHRAGAGFALEDVYVLARGIAWAHEQNLSLQEGIELFDQVRGPYYRKLYRILDQFADADAHISASNFGFDDTVQATVDSKWSKKYNWIAEYDIQKVLKEVLNSKGSYCSKINQSPRL
ncbi:Uncharacterized protein BP5553_07112 [Venustampulla echinocandica]|uniref:FAD-binding domain-containing protein n=1 Tax=Venustampulla echinocandica TaxID=2656787 RepID=A0A370TIJ1_9HELO|nr:Uncharacterized protein BP5553_07112 [Venustampulla echinocandica]RDL35181.1 Uncharacterized protein BP5553_07112 [Venustampulla echinocandica]